MALPQIIQVPTPAKAGLTIGKAIGGIIVFGGIIYFGKKAYNSYKAKQQLVTDQASTIKPPSGKILYDLRGKPIQSLNLATIATELNGFLNFPVNQERSVSAFLDTPFGYVPQLEKLYLQKYNDNLKDRLFSKLSTENWIKIKNYFSLAPTDAAKKAYNIK